MVLHMPWSRDVGGSRVQFELAEEFVRLGHKVDKFDVNDAVPPTLRSSLKFRRAGRILRMMLPGFSSMARRFVQKRGSNYDVIDAHHGNLPFSKSELHFDGVLACRSVGLIHFYNAFSRQNPAADQYRARTVLHRLLERLESRQGISDQDADRSFRAADVILVPTEHEAGYLNKILPDAAPASVVPFGLREEVLNAFRQANTTRRHCRNASHVAFIGSWDRRKGRDDWPHIVRKVRSASAETTFLLLGTVASEATVVQAFSPEDRPFVKVVPRYSNHDTPQHLSQATVAAFPSYLEGFAYGALELVAAGLPVVAYDIPSVAALITCTQLGSLVRVGDTHAFSDALLNHIRRTPEEATKDSEHCLAHAASFNLPSLAEKTLRAYSTRHAPT